MIGESGRWKQKSLEEVIRFLEEGTLEVDLHSYDGLYHVGHGQDLLLDGNDVHDLVQDLVHRLIIASVPGRPSS